MKDMQLHHSGTGVSDWSSINQYCPIADHGQRHVRMGHWLCDRRREILELLVISQTSSQNVNLTSLCRAHLPSGRFSNIFEQVSSPQTGPLTGILRNRIPLSRISLEIKQCT